MSFDSKTILKNIGVLLGSQMVTWVLTFTLTLFLPRYLGPGGIGQLQYASSLWAVLAVLITFGTETLLIKETARNPAQGTTWIGASMLLRVVLFWISCGIITVYLWLTHATAEVCVLVVLTGCTTFILQCSNVIESVLRGLEQMSAISVASIASKALATVLSLAVLLAGYRSTGVAAVGIASSVVTLCILAVALRKKTNVAITMRGAGTLAGTSWRLLQSGWPYLCISFMMTLYGQIDTIILHALVPPDVLGWYSTAVQLYGTLLFLPVILSSAVFPAMARSHSAGTSVVPQLVSKSFDMMLLVAVPLGLGLMIISKPLVALIYGVAFAPVAPVLALLGVVLILMFQNIVLGQFLVSIDRQQQWAIMTAVAIVCTIGLDLLLVPWFQQQYGNGAIGGALSYIITEAGLLVVAIISLPRGTLDRGNLRTAARIVVAGVGMFAVCWSVQSMMIAIPILFGATSYACLVWLLRVIPADDLRRGLQLVHHARNRMRNSRMRPVPPEGA